MSEPLSLVAHGRECGGLKAGPLLGFPLIYGLTGGLSPLCLEYHILVRVCASGLETHQLIPFFFFLE